MLGGYIAQIALFDTVPDLVSLSGAALLFASVLIVALAAVQSAANPVTEDSEIELHGSQGSAGVLRASSATFSSESERIVALSA